VRDRNDFKAADVKWTGVMGDITYLEFVVEGGY